MQAESKAALAHLKRLGFLDLIEEDVPVEVRLSLAGDVRGVPPQVPPPLGIDVEVVGTAVRLLLDEADAPGGGGIYADVGRLLVRDGAGEPAEEKGGAKGGGGASGVGASSSASMGGGEIELTAGYRMHPPRPSARSVRGVADEVVRVRVDGIRVHDIVPGRHAVGARMLHESAIELTLKRTTGGDVSDGAASGSGRSSKRGGGAAAAEPKLVAVTGTGNDLVAELTPAQTKRLRQLARQLDISDADTSASQGRKPPPKRSTPSSQPAEPIQQPVVVRFAHPRVALTLGSAGAALLSTLLTNLNVGIERKLGGDTELSGAIGSWDLSGRALHDISRVRAASSDHGSSASAARPLVRVQGGVAAPPSDGLPSDGPRGDAAVIGVQTRGLGSWLCCCCRTGEAAVKLAIGSQRLCGFWLPLVRLFAILCCCLRPVRNLLLLALPLVCETSCCCCSAACARLGRLLCHPRRRGGSSKRRPFEEVGELPSIELLAKT